MKYTTEEIENAYKSSSPKIKNISDGAWVSEACGEIGKDLNLRIDKVDILIRIVGLTLLNIVSISSFVKVIEKELPISAPNATSIAKKVDQLIFKKIRNIVSEDKKDVGIEISFEKDVYETSGLIEDIENRADDNLSFKDKFNKVTVKKSEDRIVDPYREQVD